MSTEQSIGIAGCFQVADEDAAASLTGFDDALDVLLESAVLPAHC